MTREPELKQLFEKYPCLSGLKTVINETVRAIINCYSRGGKLLICGNGGSSSDADHMVAEMMKRFEKPRPLHESFKKRLCEISDKRGCYLSEKLEHALPALSLTAHNALTSAIANDTDADLVFAQQVIGYGSEKDILIAISTSGNSQNILDACITAKALNMMTIGISGRSGGRMKKYCDLLINVPESGTAEIQELQRPVLHTICRIIENHFYGNGY
jgi:D-sedoheptulose 7-phosphate isomerase